MLAAERTMPSPRKRAKEPATKTSNQKTPAVLALKSGDAAVIRWIISESPCESCVLRDADALRERPEAEGDLAGYSTVARQRPFHQASRNPRDAYAPRPRPSAFSEGAKAACGAVPGYRGPASSRRCNSCLG